ncbi:hypothetical protein AWV80_26210 [Cupriavidus sp. UYMU48A]|nr:hypothetical protein AWV80_26210 [Cupriavidus sp. UYMU48A]
MLSKQLHKAICAKGMEDKQMTQKFRSLSFEMHAKDLANAHAAAERLGMSFQDYIRLGTHLMTTAVLSGSSTAQVPLKSESNRSWKDAKTWLKEFIERVATQPSWSRYHDWPRDY